MDAQALLKAQGWRGQGHTLHRTDDSIGLAKPLLISRKDNTLGIGKKEHCTSDQWWLNAFDQQLQGLDTTQKGVVVQTVTTGALNVISAGGRGAGRKWMGDSGGLYASFVRGGMLEGTISPALSPSSSSSSTTGGSTPRDSTHTPTANRSSESTPDADERSGSRCETKEERKARRAARRLERAEKKARTNPAGGLDAAAIVAARKLKKLERRQSETKEERRIRREVKRRRKEERRRAAATG